MALTAADLTAAVRLGAQEAAAAPLSGMLARLLVVGTSHVDRLAPDEVKERAIIQLAAYLYDQPHYGRAFAMASAWRSSGAAAILGPWSPIGGVKVDA